MREKMVPGEPKAVAAYYEESWSDYRLLWLNSQNRAVHIGYWDEDTRSHSESLIKVNRVLANDIGVRPGMVIVDAGCGVGGTAMWLAANYDVKVMGITVSLDQARRARLYASERGLSERVSFSVQDYRRTAFPEGMFDAVYGVESVCYASDKRDFIAEAFRLLKPGGRLVVQDGFRTDRSFTQKEERIQESWLSGWAVPNFATVDGFVKRCLDVGFVNVRAEDQTKHYLRSCRRLYRLTLALYPLAFALYKLGIRSAVQHGNTRGARDQWRALKRQLWCHATIVADKPHGRIRPPLRWQTGGNDD